MKRVTLWFIAIALLGSACVSTAETDAGLAQELTNPLADLVTVPIQMNFDVSLQGGLHRSIGRSGMQVS